MPSASILLVCRLYDSLMKNWLDLVRVNEVNYEEDAEWVVFNEAVPRRTTDMGFETGNDDL